MSLLKYIFLVPFAAAAVVAVGQVEVVRSPSPAHWLNVKNDKRYIEDHTKDLTVRLYTNNKFSRYVIGQNGNGERLPYSTNDHLSLGLGFNWRFIGLNVGVKMPFVNGDDRRFGKTKGIDIQSFFYFRKLQVDIYGQAYDGLYVANRTTLNRPRVGDVFPYRSDLKLRNFGINGQYIFNNRRFSYRAAFVQNEYQKKSAGSFILGGAIYHFRADADSAILPRDLKFPGDFWRNGFNQSRVTSLAVNAGYAYTLVIRKHFFMTASFAVGPGLNYTSLRDVAADKNSGGLDYHLNGTLRLAAGYNSPGYFAGVQYIRLTNKDGISDPATWQQFETGSFRVTIAKRFKLNRKFEKKVLNAIEDVKDDVEEVIR